MTSIWRVESDGLFHHGMYRHIVLVSDDMRAALTTNYQAADGMARALVRYVPTRLKTKWYGLDGRARRLYESVSVG